MPVVLEETSMVLIVSGLTLAQRPADCQGISRRHDSCRDAAIEHKRIGFADSRTPAATIEAQVVACAWRRRGEERTSNGNRAAREWHTTEKQERDRGRTRAE